MLRKATCILVQKNQWQERLWGTKSYLLCIKKKVSYQGEKEAEVKRIISHQLQPLASEPNESTYRFSQSLNTSPSH